MQIILHQTHNTIGDFEKILNSFKKESSKWASSELHIFPESYLCGYPLQDLCLQSWFLNSYEANKKRIDAECKKIPSDRDWMALMGGMDIEYDEKGLPQSIHNVVYALQPGKGMKSVYTKRLLPNYDIFDEKKYYNPGTKLGSIEFNQSHLGILICEDMWMTHSYPEDPVQDLLDHHQSRPFDAIINLSASPFHLGKHPKRIKRASEISRAFKRPFIYVNCVGLEDEVLFDGRSFAIYGERVMAQAETFKEDQLKVELAPSDDSSFSEQQFKTENTWESLFDVTYLPDVSPPTLSPLQSGDLDTLIHAIGFALRDYCHKNNCSKVTIALSGGLDSSVVATCATLYCPEIEIEGLFMPSQYTSTESYDLVEQLCKNLDIPWKTIPIKFLHGATQHLFRDQLGEALEGLADENIQSRLRGALLFARSNQTHSLVLNTSNKSEIAVGYSTLYGDSVGALSLLGDLYKTEVYQLAKHLNALHPHIIPEGIITRPPTAELRAGQIDAQSLPSYEVLDAILEGFLSYRKTPEDLVELGFSPEDTQKVFQLWIKSEFKRKQFCPILKLKAKSFGFGYRVPICKKVQYNKETIS